MRYLTINKKETQDQIKKANEKWLQEKPQKEKKKSSHTRKIEAKFLQKT